ncbi:MAG: glutamine-hydrolyzing GMP synthase, partial [Chloroflexi bacterium]|nr:glutamine-hydrolyzing GMP synthase [Chloroflexota bacterium]
MAVIDFGSQYSQLIARRVRECNVYCELIPYNAPVERLAALNPRGFILSGGPASVYQEGAPKLSSHILNGGLPILGICYGMQLLAIQLGGEVAPGARREYGHAELHLNQPVAPIFQGLPESFQVWMSHGDIITRMPPGFRPLAHTENSPLAAMGNDAGMVGLQFHPEVVHTPLGKEILRNFLYRECGCQGNWTPGSYIAETVAKIREQVGDGKVICALSGGVDSTVAATLIHRAIGDRLTCVFVNNGLLRLNEAESTLETFRRHLQLNVVYVDATDRFLSALGGAIDPERKRRIIGEEFIRVFEAEAARLGQIDFLAQGTLYPDVIESTSYDTTVAARIKSHHNVGGLPEKMSFALVEPLRYLFKDEVRRVGLELGLPESMVWRQP